MNEVAMSNNEPAYPASSDDSVYEPSLESSSSDDTDLEEETMGILQPVRVNPVRAVRIPESGEGSDSMSERTLAVMQQMLESMMVNQARDYQAPVTKSQIAFRAQNPPLFTGDGLATQADEWIRVIEEIFYSLDMHTDKVRMVTAPTCLRGRAANWWQSVILEERAREMSWATFKEKFLNVYFPKHERHAMRTKFFHLVQGVGTVTNYRQEFMNLSRYGPDLVRTEEARCQKFEMGLNPKIQLALSVNEYQTLDTFADAAARVELSMKAIQTQPIFPGGNNAPVGYQGNRNSGHSG